MCCVRATDEPHRARRRAEPDPVQFVYSRRCVEEETKKATVNGLGTELFFPGAIYRIQWIQLL